jgi:hypothetical protein
VTEGELVVVAHREVTVGMMRRIVTVAVAVLVLSPQQAPTAS